MRPAHDARRPRPPSSFLPSFLPCTPLRTPRRSQPDRRDKSARETAPTRSCDAAPATPAGLEPARCTPATLPRGHSPADLPPVCSNPLARRKPGTTKLCKRITRSTAELRPHQAEPAGLEPATSRIETCTPARIRAEYSVNSLLAKRPSNPSRALPNARRSPLSRSLLRRREGPRVDKIDESLPGVTRDRGRSRRRGRGVTCTPVRIRPTARTTPGQTAPPLVRPRTQAGIHTRPGPALAVRPPRGQSP